MKNRKREICTSGSVRDEDGNLLIYSAADDFCIWPQVPPRCLPSRASLGRKPIHRGRCVWLSAPPQEADSISSHA